MRHRAGHDQETGDRGWRPRRVVLGMFLALGALSCHSSSAAKVEVTGTGGAAEGTGGTSDASPPDGTTSVAEGTGGAGGMARPAPVCLAPTGTAPAATAAAVDPGGDGDGDFVIGPSYTDAPELLGMLGVPRGALKSFVMSSSPPYPGLAGPYSRTVTVFIPSQYVPGTPAPFMVVQDGSSFVANVPAVLNNMINDHRLPVMIAILINPGPGDGPGSERSLEYDTVSETYVNFIERDVLPTVQDKYGVTLTNDPDGRATMGWSSGAAAAFTMGWQCPSLYRRILTYSGTFVNIHPDDLYPLGAWEYPQHLIADSDVKPLRVFLEVGTNDNGANLPETSYRNWVLANQGMATALRAKGYHYRFVTGTGAGHIDPRVVGQTLPETLAWLWRGFPVD